MPRTQAIEGVDDPLAQKVELPTGIEEPEENFVEFMEAAFEKAREMQENAEIHGVEFDLSEENVRHVDFVIQSWRDPKVRIWLKDCTAGDCRHVTLRCGDLNDYMRKQSCIIDIREF